MDRDLSLKVVAALESIETALEAIETAVETIAVNTTPGETPEEPAGT